MSKSHDYFRKGISRCNPALYKRSPPPVLLGGYVEPTVSKEILNPAGIIILKVGKEGKGKILLPI